MSMFTVCLNMPVITIVCLLACFSEAASFSAKGAGRSPFVPVTIPGGIHSTATWSPHRAHDLKKTFPGHSFNIVGGSGSNEQWYKGPGFDLGLVWTLADNFEMQGDAASADVVKSELTIALPEIRAASEKGLIYGFSRSIADNMPWTGLHSGDVEVFPVCFRQLDEGSREFFYDFGDGKADPTSTKKCPCPSSVLVAPKVAGLSMLTVNQVAVAPPRWAEKCLIPVRATGSATTDNGRTVLSASVSHSLSVSSTRTSTRTGTGSTTSAPADSEERTSNDAFEGEASRNGQPQEKSLSSPRGDGASWEARTLFVVALFVLLVVLTAGFLDCRGDWLPDNGLLTALRRNSWSLLLTFLSSLEAWRRQRSAKVEGGRPGRQKSNRWALRTTKLSVLVSWSCLISAAETWAAADSPVSVIPNRSLGFLRPGGILSGILGPSENVTLERGNYTAIGTLVVDGYLTILPGAQLNLAPNVSLVVRNGSLVATGSENDPVLFVSTTTGSYWGQIRVFPDATGQHVLRLSNAVVSGAGSEFVPAIHTQRVSELTNVVIQDCAGGAILADDNFLNLLMNNVRSLDVNVNGGYYPSNVEIGGSGDVSINNSLFSSFAKNELVVYDSVTLSAENLQIYPKAPWFFWHIGVYATNSFTAIRNLTFLSADDSFGVAIYSSCDSFELRSSRIAFQGWGVQVIASPSSTHRFIGNSWIGSPSSVYLASVTDGSTSFYNNTFESSNCSSDCFWISGPRVEFLGNRVDSVAVSQSLIRLFANQWDMIGNVFSRISGDTGIELPWHGSLSYNFTRNVWVDVNALVLFVKTTTLFDNVEGGVYSFPENHWDGSSFEMLRARTYDAQDDPGLAYIMYASMFVDADMTTLLEPPTTPSCLNTVRRSISCVIRDASTVVVPSGLYYAPRSIVLRHPNSLLVLEAGARIMFAPDASIRIDQGTFEVRGTSSNPVVLTSTSQLLSEFGSHDIQNASQWGGVSFGPNSNPSVTFSGEYISGSILQGCVIQNAGYLYWLAAVSMDQVSVMFRQVSVLNSGSRGVQFHNTRSAIVMKDSTISDSVDYGLLLWTPTSSVSLDTVTVRNSGSWGVYAYWHQNLSLSECQFVGNREYQVYSIYGYGSLEVTKSIFDGIQSYGMYVDYSYWWWELRVFVSESIFSGTKWPVFILAREVSLSFSNFSLNTCVDADCDSLSIDAFENIAFIGNTVESNVASRIVHLQARSLTAVSSATVYGNRFLQNQAISSSSGKNAVLALTSGEPSLWKLNGNKFLNPASSLDITTHGYSGAIPGDMVVNATGNHFAYPPSASEQEISLRIFDMNDDSSKPLVSFVPFIPANYTPSCPGNCTGQGVCVFPGFCICRPGWGGERCNLPTCQTLEFCSGRGQCISFDTCRCDEGWLGASCSKANCTLRNDCNGNGRCTLPNVCSCYGEFGFAGQDCNECRADYRLIDASCKKCPPCQTGTCNSSAQCDCIGNSVGDLCDSCKDGFFGEACQPLPYLVDVVPNDAPDFGGTVVQLTGMNLGNVSSSLLCLFTGEPPVNASFVSEDAVQCPTPRVSLTAGSLTTSLSLQIGTSNSHNSLPFTFYGLCPADHCFNGYCSFGRCQCYNGFRGATCNETILEPVISDVPAQPIMIVEGEFFTYSFSLRQGSLPVEFSLKDIPPSGVMISKDGVLSWENPSASSKTIAMSIVATNELASDEVQLYVDVRPSYRVVVKAETTKAIRPSRPLLFDIETQDFAGRRVDDKMAVLWVQKVGSTYRRKTNTKTNGSGTFSRTFLPYATDVGDFVFGGEHPDHEDLTIQGGFTILGVDISASSYFLTGYPGEAVAIPNVFLFTFHGGAFTNISVAFDDVDGVEVNATLDREVVNQTANGVSMSISVAVSEPMKRGLQFVLTTAQGVTASGLLYIDVRDRFPRFEVTPSVVKVAVARGGAAFFQNVNIKNIGSRGSGMIDVILPNHPIVSSVSGNALPGLAVDESASVTLAFSPSSEMSLGTVFTGTVGFVFNNTFATLDYQVEVVSEITASLTVVTQNEATYFAEGAPNLAGVLVSVVSRSSGRTSSGITGVNGTIVFANLTEDVYDIVAQKLEHKSFRREILLISPGMTLLAFLPTDVVSYTFTVVPVPIFDKYFVDVTTTFKTNVPMPVVVFEPADLDWEGIRFGLVDEITITATNYGYIAAENVTFTWPKYWETAHFILPNGDKDPSRTRNLGTLPANASMTFTVKVEQTKRNSITAGRVELCSPVSNTCYFLPRADDPRWAVGDIDFIVSPGNDLIGGQMFVKLNADGNVQYIYAVDERNLFEFVYEYNATSNSSEVVDVIRTRNTSLPSSSRYLEASRDDKGRDLRELGSISEWYDCLYCALCEELKSLAGKKFGQLAGRALKKLAKYVDDVLDEVFEIVGVYEDVEGFVESFSLFECSGCNSVPMIVVWCVKCGPFHLCGAFGYTELQDSRNKTCGVSGGSGGSGGSFGGYGYGDGGKGWCTLEDIEVYINVFPARKLSEIPDHVIPSHRAILEGCPVCSPDVLRTALRTIDTFETNLTAAETAMQSCVDAAKSSGGLKSLFPCVIRQGVEFLRFIPLLSEAVTCQLSQEPCYRSVDLATSPGLANLLIQARRIQSFTALVLLPFGGFLEGDSLSLLNASNPRADAVSSFNTLIIDGIADQSSSGRGISAAELSVLQSTNLPLPSGTDIERFVSLWNRSLDLWDEGIFGGNTNTTSSYFDLDGASALMSKFQSSRATVRQEGYRGLADAWLSAVEGQQFEEARKLAGICATVRVKIEQEFTLTRTGFEARLEVSNDGGHRLENVSVALRAAPFGNASFDATHLFVFGDPTLDVISAVDGTGAIDANRVGSAAWLIVPLSEAAPVFETKYDISGILLYSIQGIKYEQYFAPSTISVVPDPQLHLTYFHSRVAYANDPFTNGVVEPAIPFHLGVLIDNRGFGEARNVEMVSSQPEIVENLKGLLVNFKIVGARLGNQPLSKSLKIDFGTIGPRTKSLGVWELVSSLRGEFFNFSAKFRYQGPIDDERLSLIDSVKIYELTHLVRVTGQHPAMPTGGLGYNDDGLDDFLVNRLPDAYYLPDTVFTSDTRGTNYSVGAVRNRGWWNETPAENLADGSFSIVVRHNLTDSERSLLPDWVYLRFNDPMARTDYILQSVTRPDVNYTLIPQYNSWQTSWTTYLSDDSIVNEDFVHLFDFGVSEMYVLRYTKQQPVTSLQVTARSNHTLTVTWLPASGGTASYVLYKPSSLVSDSYFKVAEEFLQINSCVISGLASGTDYTIQVFTGAASGIFERTGARITGATMGTSTCGNGVLDTGEDCDDGLSNGSPSSNCTDACYMKVIGSPPNGMPSSKPTLQPAAMVNPTKAPTSRPVTRAPTSSPSRHPTRKPTRFPTQLPNTGVPTRSPTQKPAAMPTRFPTKKPTTMAPAPKPTLPQCRRAAQSCSSVGTSLKCCTGLACRANAAAGGALRCVACRATGTTCGTTTTPCCDGLKCHSTTKKCVTCRAVGATCGTTSTTQCCDGLKCHSTTKKCVTCRAVGATCGTTSTTQCCDGLKCGTTKKCVTCKARGTTCSSTAQCCTGLACSTTTKKCA